MMTRLVTRTLAFACVALAAGARTAPLRAQTDPQSTATLASVDSLIAHSRFRDATAALDQWDRDHANRITPAERATALLLHARLTQPADSARLLYLALSLGYPSSPEAPVALLRLGQIAAATEDSLRAVSYFQRVIRDYPASAVHDDAVTWLARMKARGPAAPTPPASRDAANGVYALQVGAFRESRTAVTVARQLTQRGFESRIVTVPGSTLARVRIGRFATTRAADDLMRRLRAAGYEAIVVDDARTEADASKR